MAANSDQAEKEKKQRGSGRPFEKGQSGNPNGRPKTPEEFKQLARENSLAALQKVIAIMHNDEAKLNDQLKAAEMVMDRAWGKPIQGMEVSGPEGNALTIKLEGALSEWSK